MGKNKLDKIWRQGPNVNTFIATSFPPFDLVLSDNGGWVLDVYARNLKLLHHVSPTRTVYIDRRVRYSVTAKKKALVEFHNLLVMQRNEAERRLKTFGRVCGELMKGGDK